MTFSKNSLLVSGIFLQWFPVFNFIDLCFIFNIPFLLIILGLICSSFYSAELLQINYFRSSFCSNICIQWCKFPFKYYFCCMPSIIFFLPCLEPTVSWSYKMIHWHFIIIVFRVLHLYFCLGFFWGMYH